MRTLGWSGLAGVAAVVLLQVWALRAQSLTVDEPYHLLAGHQALRYGQNTLNLEHPPLVKLVAALPLAVAAHPLAPPAMVGGVLATAQEAVFRDRATVRRGQIGARAMLLVAFALPWLLACYVLGRLLLGAPGAAVLALAMGLSFTTVPYLTIVQTDAAVALGFAAVLIAVLLYLREPTMPRLVAIGLGCGLALAAKFSGVLALPPALLAVVVARPGRRAWRKPWHLAVLASVAALVVGMTYAAANRRYDSDRGRETIRLYSENQGTLVVADSMRRYEDDLLEVERFAPNLAQWLTGLLGLKAQNSLRIYPSYAFGRIDSVGRWWHYPAVLSIKLPIVVLLASLAALVAWRKRRGQVRGSDAVGRPEIGWREQMVLALTLVGYLAVAMTSSYHVGIRYLLPVFPLLYLPAVWWASRRSWIAAVFVGCLLIESLAVAPLWLSSTNTWWLGKWNPTRFALADDNCDWKQNLLVLRREAVDRGLDPLWVVDPTLTDAARSVYLPEARLATPGSSLAAGWYAVGAVVEQKLPAIRAASPSRMYNQAGYEDLAKQWWPLWQTVRRGEDHGYIAGTYHLYRVGNPG